MDSVTDAVLLPANRAQVVQNGLVDRVGTVRAQFEVANPFDIDQAMGYPIDGIEMFTGTDPRFDRLVTAAGGNIYQSQYIGAPTASLPFIPPYPAPFFYNPQELGGEVEAGAYTAGEPVRGAMFNDQLVLAATSAVLRLEVGTPSVPITPLTPCQVFPLSLTVPDVSLSAVGLDTGGTSQQTVGTTYTYKISFVDDHGFESDLSDGLNIFIRADPITHIVYPAEYVYVPLLSATPPGAVSVNLYRNTAGQSDTWFQVATGLSVGGFIQYDGESDSDVSGNTVGPLPGENAYPNNANIITVHKNRVVLNDLTNPSAIQISGEGNPTQFSLQPYYSTDGLPLIVSEDQGDPVTALVSIGSLLLIFRYKSTWLLFGDGAPTATGTGSDFIARPVNLIGCIATDTAVRCRDAVFFLSYDGVYILQGSETSGVSVQKISKELDALFAAYWQSAAGRSALEQSCACFDGQRYWIYFGFVGACYDMDSQGWTMLAAGTGSFGTNMNTGIVEGQRLQAYDGGDS